MTHYPATLGMIFAGGRGSRLGGIDKARLRVGGETLASLALAALAEQAETVFVARGRDDAPLPGSGFSVVIDRDGGPFGPAGALAAVVAATRAWPGDSLIVTTAVDTPAVLHDFAARCAAIRGGSGCVVGSHGGRLYYTQALWQLDCLRARVDAIAPGSAPGLHAIVPDNAVPLVIAGLENPFANVNTLADLRHRTAMTTNR